MDKEAEALVALYVTENGHVAQAATKIARDLIDTLTELTELKLAVAKQAEKTSAGYERRRLRKR